MDAPPDRFDVLVASDLRLPGGTSASVVAECQAVLGRGWRVGLLHVPSRLVRGERALAPAVVDLVRDGSVELVAVPPSDVLRARLLVLRHPTVFASAAESRPRVVADRVVMVANHATEDGGGVNYDPVAVDHAVQAWTGARPDWYPIGPEVRGGLTAWAGRVSLAGDDWPLVLHPSHLAPPRPGPRADRPVIGRHSRPQAAKWPTDAVVLRTVYPTDGSAVVRVLGGARPVQDVLGAVPPQWHVEPFGARDPRSFLADVDFWVYFHAPQLREAFGRAILEALASGAVVVLPPHFAGTFGDAALYREADEVPGTLHALHQDAEAYRRQSRLGQVFAARFLPAAHSARVAVLLGEDPEPPTGADPPPPTAATDAGAGEGRRSRSGRADRPKVLFVTSNGAGMGHLTRLLSYAHRMTADVDPVFLSLSSAAPVVEQVGAVWEYCPSRGALGTSTKFWNAMFRARFVDAVRAFGPRAVVFDGTWPYQGLVEARSQFPDVRFVWSRRAMWKETVPPDQLDKSSYFDLVLEPGEYAAPFDRGATTGVTDAVRLDPVTYLDRDDLVDRASARRDLGLDPDGPALLLTLGAGNINDTADEIQAVMAQMALDHPRWQVCVTTPAIADRQPGADGTGTMLRHVRAYPLSRHFAAFDAAVAASGYNAYHELVYFGVPTLFVPNLHTVTDDQRARARYAAHAGVGLCSDDLHDGLAEQLHRLTDPSEAERMRGRAAETYPGNGAAVAARHIGRLVGAEADA